MTNHFITTPRGQFHYRQFGEAQMPALVLIHGYPQSSYCWVEVAELLEENFYIIAPDLRGMGDSERTLAPKAYTKDELARDVISILEELKIEDFYLVGHDWGSAVAQEIAHQITPRIRKLVSLNFPILQNQVGQNKAYAELGQRLFAPFWYQFFQRLPELPENLLAGKEDFWIRFTVRGAKHEISETAIQEYVRCQKIPNTITTYANLYRTMKYDFKRWAMPDFVNKKLPLTTLVLHGEEDSVIVKAYYEGIENCFDTVSVEYLAAGHFVMDELPKEVAERLADFFN